jgi:hypothetical protein
VRRSLAVVLTGLALVVFAAPAQATSVVRNVWPSRAYQIEGACTFIVYAQERGDHKGLLTLDDSGQPIGVQYRGSYDTELASSAGMLIVQTIGSTVITANGDGTWTMVQKGSGIAVVPKDDPEGPKLVWFTGTVTSVGAFDPKTLDFTPVTQTREALTSNLCGLFTTGLKHRHDTL